MVLRLTCLLSFIFLCLWQTTIAQEKTVLLDTLTFTSLTSLPFDETFFLGIPVKNPNVTSAAYVQVKKNGQFYDDKPPVNDTKLEVKKLGTQNYLFIEVKNPHLLIPGKRYSFLWTEGLDDNIVDAFDYYDDYKITGDTAAFNKAKGTITGIAKANLQKFGDTIDFYPDDTALSKFNSHFYSNRDKNLPAKYIAYKSALSHYNATLTTTVPLQLRDTARLNLLLNAILRKSDYFDSDIKEKMFKDVKLAVFRINRLLTITDAGYAQLKKGLLSLDCDTCKPEKEKNYTTRLSNIDNTVAALSELYFVASSLQTIPGITGTSTLLHDLTEDMKNGETKLKTVIDARKPVTSAIEKFAISNFKQVGGSTVAQTFDVRTKLSIAPDFGFVTTRLFDDKKNPYAFAPYLGFHVNFRPLNRDIPFWSYRHSWKSYLSGFAGWTLVNVSDGPTLTNKADSITGFFSGGKGTLMVGLGGRLGNFVRITSGGMFYFKYDKKTPLSTDYNRKLKAWPFVGLSLDIALKDLLNGITDVFSGAPRVYNPPVVSQ